jgi:hypothetical protein
MSAPQNVGPMVSVLTLAEADDYTCACGNTSSGDGFFPVDPENFEFYADEEGIPQAPLVDQNWTGHYRCIDCDAITQIVEGQS